MINHKTTEIFKQTIFQKPRHEIMNSPKKKLLYAKRNRKSSSRITSFQSFCSLIISQKVEKKFIEKADKQKRHRFTDSLLSLASRRKNSN